MTEQQEKFLRLAVIDQLLYDDIEKQLELPRKEFAHWWDELKEERDNLTSIRMLWQRKFKNLDFEKVQVWYENVEKKCHYCNITEEKIAKLREKYPELTKRKRGKVLEIERKDPNQSYENLDNLTLSCYWCNNAKTDTFTEKEFVQIGKVIEQIWQKRLQDGQ